MSINLESYAYGHSKVSTQRIQLCKGFKKRPQIIQKDLNIR